MYLCSSPFIAEREFEFVERWIREIRIAGDDGLGGVGILVRPHPENRQPWQRLREAGDSNLAIWPPVGANPVDADAQDDYFHSLFHSRAVVGINSSGLIEAGIVGRPVLTILDPDFAATQEGTLHFRYLVEVGGGLLQVARTWGEHREHLRAALATDPSSLQNRGFLREFVRPLGLDVEAAPVMTQSLIDLGTAQAPASRAPGLLARTLQMALRPMAAVSRRHRPTIRVRVGRDSARPSDMAAGIRPEVDRARRAIESLKGSNAERILVGPWYGDVAYEVLYWIPFVRWAVERSGLDPGRLVAITRGGAAVWYTDLAATSLDILEYMTLEEVASGRQEVDVQSGRVQKSMTSLDREVVRIVKQFLDARNVRVLHPSVMLRAFGRFWADGTGPDDVGELTVHRRLPLPKELDRSPFPEDYVALRLSYGPRFPDTAENRSILTELVETLTDRSAVVLLGSSRELINELDPASRGQGNLLDPAVQPCPSNELAHAAGVIARARALVSTDDMLSFVAPFYGVDSVVIRSQEVARGSFHFELAQRALDSFAGSGSLTVLPALQRSQLVTILNQSRSS